MEIAFEKIKALDRRMEIIQQLLAYAEKDADADWEDAGAVLKHQHTLTAAASALGEVVRLEVWHLIQVHNASKGCRAS